VICPNGYTGFIDEEPPKTCAYSLEHILDSDGTTKENRKMMDAAKTLIADIESTFPGRVAYIVGGAVRDVVMGHAPHDVDIATNADIDALTERYGAVNIGKSKEFGIVDVGFGGERFEVAAFRVETGTLNSRHPERVKFVDDLREDLARRDFTINSMALGVGGIIDPHDGQKDIRDKVIRAVGIAHERFQEDALRILRAARFAARLGFTIEAATKASMIDHVSLMEKLSKERIRDELVKVASVSGAALAQFVEIMDEISALDLVCPCVRGMKGFEHTPETHPEGGVYEHTLAALRKSRSSNPLVNLAVLFHDIGKPPTRTYNDHGHVCYKGHEAVGAKMFREVAEHLKFSNEQTNAILFAIENHMIAHRLHTMKKSKLVNIRQSPFYEVLIETCYADDASRGEMFDEADFQKRADRVESLYQVIGEREEFEARMKKYVHGRMIMDIAAESGVVLQGVQIGSIKKMVRETVVESNFEMEPGDAEKLVRALVAGISKSGALC